MASNSTDFLKPLFTENLKLQDELSPNTCDAKVKKNQDDQDLESFQVKK